MDKRTVLILGAGLILCAVFFLVDIYLGGIAIIILTVLAMSLFIMQDSASLPEIGVALKDNAKGIVVINRGNDTAYNIHIALVPCNIEFDLPTLEADATFDYPLATMLTEANVLVTYKNAKGIGYSRKIQISALGKSDDDLLKPMIPLFSWK